MRTQSRINSWALAQLAGKGDKPIGPISPCISRSREEGKRKSPVRKHPNPSYAKNKNQNVQTTHNKLNSIQDTSISFRPVATDNEEKKKQAAGPGPIYMTQTKEKTRKRQHLRAKPTVIVVQRRQNR
ncbi:hypothetical protein K7X08_021007 [Anisodus acutangulus]|uniref:Uncharacterized protein n=1 Tax=Anisodus acutangulus TaxID=402998 RepID=A0A9Q1MTJ7_9SOLA|nr:hypothetical protein K7X08_021007 [Anisodus acutangulus]